MAYFSTCVSSHTIGGRAGLCRERWRYSTRTEKLRCFREEFVLHCEVHVRYVFHTECVTALKKIARKDIVNNGTILGQYLLVGKLADLPPLRFVREEAIL